MKDVRFFFDNTKPISQKLTYRYSDDPPPPPDCFCHVGNFGYSCKKWSYGFPSGITVEYGLCESGSSCGGSGAGCGLLWLESCYGGHCNF